MRKREYLQINRLLDLLAEVHKEMSGSSGKESLEKLTDCQDIAIKIGQVLEQEQYTYKIAITLLEEYCEQLYNTSLCDKQKMEKAIAVLNDQLNKIVQELIKEIRITYLIVFLPYKASMWDSMETVWKAACEDEYCMPLVIPVPYFTSNQDGKFVNYYYEGNLFPSNVPIIKYNSIDLANLKPDIIYIHNPYDGGNYVTRVYLDYYSRRLKELTDMLVYIPYFVGMEDITEEFCQQPGVLYADKVILQSDKIRQRYLFYYQKLLGNKWEGEKFIALGSPKFDKIQKYNMEDFKIPEEWKARIGNRKILLYNTHLKSLLVYGEAGLQKIRQTIDFLINYTDIILWWRPHPLIEETARSMRPDLLKQYQELVDTYKHDERMIYDESTDLQRALMVSQGYYGDSSSLVALYLMTGKPVMIQTLCNPYIGNVAFMSCLADDGRYLWYFMWDNNWLYRTDTLTNETEKVCCFDKEEASSYLYGGIEICGNQVIGIPRLASHIGIYRIDTREKLYISFNVPDDKYWKTGKFAVHIKYGNCIYMLGIRVPVILRLDLVTYELKYIDEWYQQIKKDITEEENELPRFFWGDVYSKDNIFYAPISCINAVLKFNMLDESIQIYYIGTEKNGFDTLCFDGTGFWLGASKGDRILHWVEQTQEIDRKITVLPDGFCPGKRPFMGSVLWQNQIWLIPFQANKLLRVEVGTGQVSEYRIGVRNKADTEELQMFAYINREGELCLIDNKFRTWYCINRSNGEIITYQYKTVLETNDFAEHYIQKKDKLFENHCIFVEGGTASSLEAYLEYIQHPAKELVDMQMEYTKNLSVVMDGTSGEKIHQYILGQVLI